ncbi:hypothetical protein PHLGIDRAFT_30987 [Phlebiopsis gigantea 11061_1 CR5-6]|uniref:Peptidase A1 domain-containing protein n=1 Tax=Phlebiopsis gigantea (strain 11061_1 CR5-6) TaxID=745531 RepID=A0A0C3S8E4_PHLG1|nr:hypothetical protein PHLGIDRAFT_30987 [Phlebiopsis gigantea 11061_1 CR5-6]
MTIRPLVLGLLLASLTEPALATAIEHVRRGGIHLPLFRTEARQADVRKRDTNSAGIGVGDFLDVTYNVLVQVGGIETPLVLDTGSADLWVISKACTGNCSSTVPLYPQTTFQSTGQNVQLLYGDSRTGTHAAGPIGKDSAGVAGLAVADQYLASIIDTNTTLLETGSAGIFGLGFPAISVLWRQLIQAQLNEEPPTISGRALADVDFRRTPFPSFDFLTKTISFEHHKRQNTSLRSSPEVIASFDTYGPLFTRLVADHRLAEPMFATTLQRDSIDIGGNVGQLSIGELPAGIKSDSLTWVPLRAYTPQEGGLPPSSDAPHEVYPLVWEIAVDDVYFDGAKLARSQLSSPSITLSALIDTGNSLMRGPQDVVAQIYTTLGGETFDCALPHNLTFVIGGKLFPVDPRDFVLPALSDTRDGCVANLASTDPPGAGFLYSWSLGDPFLKSVLAAFHYGNLTHPSQDPPRIGLLSTVPADSGARLQSAVSAAADNGGAFTATSHLAPSGTFVASTTGVGGVPQATAVPANTTTADATPVVSSAVRTPVPVVLLWAFCALVLGLSYL